jgi:transcriptional regulator with XRE-family HTH domain
MASHQLSNHVRKYRKRSALSQRDVAYLLGVASGSKVCRYERFTREPGFSTALAYEAIFQVAVSELFPGLYQRIEAGVRARAKRLMERKSDGKPSRGSMRRRQTLAAIACVDSKPLLKPE